MAVSSEIQSTFDFLFDLAQKALSEGRSFAPFATSELKNGERTYSMTDLNVASSTPQDHMIALIKTLQGEASAGRLKSAGLVFDTVAPFDDGKTSDALCIHAEAAGEAVQIFVPYERGRMPAPKYSEPVIQPVAARIFIAH